MVTKQQVETSMSTIKKDIETNATLIADTEKRLSAVTARSQTIRTENDALRNQRQTALANGKDVSAINSKLKALTEEVDLVDDEIAGLTKRLETLKGEADALGYKLAETEARIPQIRSVELANQYNKLAAQLGQVVLELNDILDAQPENKRAVFYRQNDGDGAMSRIPKLIFDEDVLDIDGFTKKHEYSARNHVNAHNHDDKVKILYWDRAMWTATRLQAINANREPVNPFAK